MKNEYVNLVEETNVEHLVEGPIWDKISNFAKKQGDSLKENLQKLFQELYHENKEAMKTLYKYSKDRDSVSKEEIKEVANQILDNIKILGLGAIAIPPGGGAALIVLIKLATKFNIPLKPSAWEK